MLRRKTKLVRASRIEEANHLASKIGKCIIKINTATIVHVNGVMDPKEMWGKVWSLVGRKAATSNDAQATHNITASALNDHYANISSDLNYTSLLKANLQHFHRFID